MATKFRAHETFFIRKGWLSKGMRYVSQKPDVFTDKDDNPMDVLGIGANMVKSLRYGLCLLQQSGWFWNSGKMGMEHCKIWLVCSPVFSD